MKINWKVRFKNPVFWFNLAASIFLPMLACLGFNWEDMTSWQAVGNRVLFSRPSLGQDCFSAGNHKILVFGFTAC